VELVQGCVVRLLILDALQCLQNNGQEGGGEIQKSFIRKLLNYLLADLNNVFSYMAFSLLI